MILDYLPSAYALINSPNDATVLASFIFGVFGLLGTSVTVWFAYKAQKNTKPNGGSSPHDRLIQNQDEMKVQLEELLTALRPQEDPK